MEKTYFYRVTEGDTLNSVAKRFGVPPLIIKSDNFLYSEIRSGQILIIKKSDRSVYTVGINENVDDVCAKFHISKEEFTAINKTDYIFYGLKVYV